MAKRRRNKFVTGYKSGSDEMWGRFGLVNPFTAQQALRDFHEFSARIQPRLVFYHLVEVPLVEVERHASWDRHCARERKARKGRR
ncbi:hypothetical protein ES708_29116 [subsurface metagenome]